MLTRENNSGSEYDLEICYGGLQCQGGIDTRGSNNCSQQTSGEFPFALLSLSGSVNAHIGNASTYPRNTVCCDLEVRPNCEIESVHWETPSGNIGIGNPVNESTNVILRVTASSDCPVEQEIQFEIFEHNMNITIPIDSFRGTYGGTNTWTTIWINDTIDDENPEYYFKATFIQGNTASAESGTGDRKLLKVKKKYVDLCIFTTSCSDYDEQVDCVKDSCNKANEGCGLGKTCECSWNAGGSSCDTIEIVPYLCGNDKVDWSGEVCDGNDVGANNCSTLGCSGTGGDGLTCSSICHFNKTGCTGCPAPGICGNERIDGLEDCDGNNLTIDSCRDVNPAYTKGNLSCNDECKFDTSQCIRAPSGGFCGDGVIEIPNSGNLNEQCDINKGTHIFLGNEDQCLQHDNFASGNMLCSNFCTYDYSNCGPKDPPVCGDGIVNQISESCDGFDLRANTCGSLGHSAPPGILECYPQGHPFECQFDVAGCINTEPGHECGNNDIDQPWEECDYGDYSLTGNCTADCKNKNLGEWCGDGTPNIEWEECDDGNNDNTDGCSELCKDEEAGEWCGDGIVNQPGEGCDMGISASQDGCSQGCLIETEDEICGDGIIQQPNNAHFNEQCDLGNLNGSSLCSDLNSSLYTNTKLKCKRDCTFDVSQCTNNTALRCGDGVVNRIEEECDTEDLAGKTCKYLGYDSGELSCDSNCKINKTGCDGGETPPEPEQPDPTPGTCTRTTELSDNCDDGLLTYDEIAVWTPGPTGESSKPGQCENRSVTIECPSQLELPFFSLLNTIITLSAIVLVYGIIIRKRNKLINHSILK